jgi:signal transduction histidine kinase
VCAHAIVTSDRLPAVAGQEPHFVQRFQNLIGNAIKYRLAVADNGIRIDPAYHQKIFGVFKRLHGQTIPETGVGLAICHLVVERYGGRIWVESQVNEGATFYFTLLVAKGLMRMFL